MDVSLPINSVIPSLDGPVLAALAGTSRPYGITAVGRLTGGAGSPAGIRKVLLRLVDAGIVLDVPGGYVLNREHIAAPSIEQLAGLQGELVGRLRAALDDWEGEVKLAGMFGSAARRDGDEHSDIDLLVVADSRGLDDLADDLADSVRRWTGNDAQIVTKTSPELRELVRAREPLVSELDRDLIVLVGDRRLLRAAA